MIKADAYGHGGSIVATTLQQAGVDALGVGWVEQHQRVGAGQSEEGFEIGDGHLAYAVFLMAFLLAVLVATNLIQIWMVILIAAGRGTMMSFNQPARQSLVSELVPAQDLQNAIALSSATQNLTRIIGPTIGGLLIASIGVAGAFFVNAASFVAVYG